VTSYTQTKHTGKLKALPEQRDAECHVTDAMLDIIVAREKTYLENARKLYGELKGTGGGVGGANFNKATG